VCHQLWKTITTGKRVLNSRQTVYAYIGYQILQLLYLKALGYDYGLEKSYQGNMNCGFYSPIAQRESNFEQDLLVIFVFEYLMMMVVIYDIVLITRHVSELKTNVSTEYYDKVNALKKSALLYPIFMLVVWTPLTLLTVIGGLYGSNSYLRLPDLFVFFVIATSWSFLDGFFNAVVYFSNGKGVRHLWSIWLSEYAIGRLYMSSFAWIQGVCLGCMNSLMTAIGCASAHGDGDGGGSRSGNPLHAQTDQDKDAENENENNEEDVTEDFLDDEVLESAMVQALDNKNTSTSGDVEFSTSTSTSL
jgi:hypothetical protein